MYQPQSAVEPWVNVTNPWVGSPSRPLQRRVGSVSYTSLGVSCSGIQDPEIRFQFSDSVLGSVCGEGDRFGGGVDSGSSGGVRFGGSALSLGSVLAVVAGVIRHRGGSDRGSIGVDSGCRN